jgi:hypothetical protein
VTKVTWEDVDSNQLLCISYTVKSTLLWPSQLSNSSTV